MYISKVKIKNFRLLKDTTLDLKKEISLLIGKNNTGKTSFLVLVENFFENKRFHYNDFPISIRKKIRTIDKNTNIDDLSIRLIMEIKYDENDNLEVLSDFMLDLDPNIRTVKILFECKIQIKLLLQKIEGMKNDEKGKFIENNLHKYLKAKIYAFDDSHHIDNDEFFSKFRHKLIEKDLKRVTSLINIQIIHARRNVVSSEDSGNKKPLSALTTSHFNSVNEADLPNKNIDAVNDLVAKMDDELIKKYKPVFEGFLKNSKDFLDLENLNVISSIQTKSLFENSSQVTYGSDGDSLPEHLNGLGYMNILYLLLAIEIKKEAFEKTQNSINLFFIEEPEAHTHPQMQYIFAKNIRTVLGKIENLQTLITSHSPHIVSHSDFEDIRYLKKIDDNVEIKNFHTDLKKKYNKNQDHFKFLEQYLNIQSAELFFASKVVFIEGLTERMLLPLFMKQLDKENKTDDNYIPLAPQNISILEVGANAKAFAPFLEFLDIKTLIITDIDTTKASTTDKGKTIYKACAVAEGECTSNATLRYFLGSPEKFTDSEFNDWFSKLSKGVLESIYSNIKIAYQSQENKYHARSFEDAFININLIEIKSKVEDFWGIKNKSELDTNKKIYDLTDKIIDKKSDFAAYLLFLALSQDVQWKCPLYIQEGLEWIAKN